MIVTLLGVETQLYLFYFKKAYKKSKIKTKELTRVATLERDVVYDHVVTPIFKEPQKNHGIVVQCSWKFQHFFFPIVR